MSDELFKITMGEEDEDPFSFMKEEEVDEDTIVEPPEDEGGKPRGRRARRKAKREKESTRKPVEKRKRAVIITAEIYETMSQTWTELFLDICKEHGIPVTFFMTPVNKDEWDFKVNFIKNRYDKAEFGTLGWTYYDYETLESATVARHLAWQSKLSKYHRAPEHVINSRVEAILARLQFQVDCTEYEKVAKIDKLKNGLIKIYLTEIDDEGSKRKHLREVVKHLLKDKLVVLKFPVTRVGCELLREILVVMKNQGLIGSIIPIKLVVDKIG